MKNTIRLLLLLLPFGWFQLSMLSAQVGHELFLSGTGGVSTLLYSAPDGVRKTGFGGSVGLGYSFFFAPQWGITVGAEYARFNTRLRVATLSDSYPATDADVPPEDFIFSYRMTNYHERQKSAMLAIPLMVQYHFGNNLRYYVGLGGKAGLPVRSSYTAGAELLEARGDYGAHGAVLDSPVSWGFGDYPNTTGKGALKLKTAYMASFEGGTRWLLDNGWLFYLGVYLDYGLNDISATATANTAIKGSPGYPARDIAHYYSHNSLLMSTGSNGAAYTDKVIPITFGIKIKIVYSPSTDRHFGSRAWISAGRLPISYGRSTAFSTRPLYKLDRPGQDLLSRLFGNDGDGSGPDATANVAGKKKTVAEISLDDDLNELKIPVLHFALSRSELPSKAKDKLDRKIAILKRHPEITILIEGHTDNSGQHDANIIVGQRRANACRSYMISKGVAPKRLKTASRAETNPRVPNDSETHKSENRRVEFIISD
jgi:outer membrane protein OmpA-like peptidoglycan-associated protein